MDEETPVFPMTQASSSTRYLWVVIFVWQLNEEFPFSVVPLHIFENTNFPMHYITGPLNDSNRFAKLHLQKMVGNMYSIFCKIEAGVSTTRRTEVLSHINEQYNLTIKNMEASMEDSYRHMIKHHCYRLLDGFTYELEPKPIRGRRGAPKMTGRIIVRFME